MPFLTRAAKEVIKPIVPHESLSSDLWTLFLDSAANTHTRRARASDGADFEMHTRLAPLELLALSHDEARTALREYSARLRGRDYSAATIKRRFATLRAWLQFARELGATSLDAAQLMGAGGMRAESDGTANRAAPFAASILEAFLALPDAATPRGSRDAALLALLCEVPLWGWQIGAALRGDFQNEILQVPLENIAAYGHSQREYSRHQPRRTTWPVLLSAALRAKLEKHRQQSEPNALDDAPLFCNFDRRTRHRHVPLTPKSVLKIVQSYGARVGISHLTARDLRTTAIACALEAAPDRGALGERFGHLRRGVWEHYDKQRDDMTD